MEPQRIECVGAIVHDDHGRLLVVQRAHPPSAGRWSVPGGRVEADEDPRAAVAREVREETTIVVTVGVLVGEVELAGETAHGQPDPRVVYSVADYRCRPIGAQTPVAGDDASDARWVTMAELRGLPLVPGLLDALGGWAVLPD
jgi:ADP-ribose pyrophosphatase YjhB (NUDIX family)